MKVPSFGPLEHCCCEMCGCEETSLVTVQHMFGEDFHVVRCVSCGLIRTNPRPSAEWKQRFYDPACNACAEAQGCDFIYVPGSRRLPAYRRLIPFLRELVPAGARLLDVGCASGLFVREACESGFRAEGCDYSEQATAYARDHFGVTCFNVSAENVGQIGEKYDVVTLLHVFEHLSRPRMVLQELRRALRPGGLLLLETVNYSAHLAMEKYLRFLIPAYRFVTEREAVPWYPFDHLYHWTPNTLCNAMTQVGFEEVVTHHLFGYRSERTSSRLYGAVRYACNVIARAASIASCGRCDFWPVLLATGREPG